MKRNIKITKKQLEEAMQVYVNKTRTEDAKQALERTKKETEQEIGGNKEVDYVVTSDELNESKTYTKSQLLEARIKYLRENSKTFTKSNFIK